MNPYWKILRTSNGFMAAIAVLIGALIINTFLSEFVLYGALSVFLFASAGIVLNDYFDVETDKINAPERPIPSGKISRSTALLYSGVLFAVGFFLTFQINIYCFVLALFNSVLEVLYAWRLKGTFLIGNVADSWFVASSFIFGSLIYSTPLSLSTLTYIIAGLAFLSNMGREIFGDIQDMTGDRAIGLRTMPTVLGEKTSKVIGSVFVLLAVAMSFLPFVWGFFGLYYLLIVVVADIIFIYALTKKPEQNQKWMRIAMIIALAAFLVGILF